jgi:hypothetical protein
MGKRLALRKGDPLNHRENGISPTDGIMLVPAALLEYGQMKDQEPICAYYNPWCWG